MGYFPPPPGHVIAVGGHAGPSAYPRVDLHRWVYLARQPTVGLPFHALPAEPRLHDASDGATSTSASSFARLYEADDGTEEASAMGLDLHLSLAPASSS
jgi:hypothetical protein